MALKKPLNSFARARKVGHNSAKKQRQIAIAKLQQWAKGKSHLIPKKTSTSTGFLFALFSHRQRIKALIYGTESLVES